VRESLTWFSDSLTTIQVETCNAYLTATTQEAKEKAVALILDAAIEYVTSKEAVASMVATAPTDSPAPTTL